MLLTTERQRRAILEYEIATGAVVGIPVTKSGEETHESEVLGLGQETVALEVLPVDMAVGKT